MWSYVVDDVLVGDAASRHCWATSASCVPRPARPCSEASHRARALDLTIPCEGKMRGQAARQVLEPRVL